MVEALVRSMPEHCIAVIEVNKGWTKY